MMAAISMLCLILGAGAVLLALLWTAVDGLKAAHAQPGIVGVILLCVGLALPVGPSDSAEGGAGAAAVSSPPSPAGQDLNLSDGPTIATRLGIACRTDSAGQAACWGDAVTLPEGPVHKIVLGRAHGCALMQSGALSCWGGAEEDADQHAGRRFVDASASLDATCALTAQGALHCFGEDLGMPPPGKRLTQVSGGAAHFCALSEIGRAHCWGEDTDGQTRAPTDQLFQSLTAGHFHTCGITLEGHTSCWGRNTEGQSSPPEDTRLTKISAGWAHTCGLSSEGQAVCWGCDVRHPKLQIDAEAACSPPDGPFSAISAGDLWRSCGLNNSGAPTCWGGIARQGGPE
jgi:alpha-tubulin suppressor-like RCC1 family protein